MSLRAETVDVLALPRTPRWTGVLAVIIAVTALIAVGQWVMVCASSGMAA